MAIPLYPGAEKHYREAGYMKRGRRCWQRGQRHHHFLRLLGDVSEGDGNIGGRSALYLLFDDGAAGV